MIQFKEKRRRRKKKNPWLLLAQFAWLKKPDFVIQSDTAGNKNLTEDLFFEEHHQQ